MAMINKNYCSRRKIWCMNAMQVEELSGLKDRISLIYQCKSREVKKRKERKRNAKWTARYVMLGNIFSEEMINHGARVIAIRPSNFI